MQQLNELLQDLSNEHQDLFRRRQAILPFAAYLDRLRRTPESMCRSAAKYMLDAFDYYGIRNTVGRTGASMRRFKLFDRPTEMHGPIVGGEIVQDEIYSILNAFVRQGHSNKLILLHGPNGSSKSTTLDSIAAAMAAYSETDEGAVYRFNWIFPTEKSANPKATGESGPIGFGGMLQQPTEALNSYALLDESKVASRIFSEFKDNPIYLLPMPQRELLLRRWISEKQGCRPEDVELPPHMLYSGLSKKNQLIMENLLTAYEGDLNKVLRHIQVERFYYSKQYRVGVATVEPRMSVDAVEKQLTMDNNIQNLPSILHNIRFHEAFGPLIEANRGMLEFSDMLKRPIESFKYLLTTVEQGTLDLPSSTANLDIVFFGTTNEKHLDAFKTVPDFPSFRSRFELITVPYLLRPSLECKIYEDDVRAVSKVIKVAPHAVHYLCTWAVMTRLKQPDPEQYENQYRALIARLDPLRKIWLYEERTMRPFFKPGEESKLMELRKKIVGEHSGVVIYEGRFGASPREVRAMLHRAAQDPAHKTLTPLAIFDALRKLIRDRTVYEFLQFEPRGKYHDAAGFIKTLEEDFADVFEHEVLSAMTLVEEGQYAELLQRYVDNVVATVKKERIYNSSTSSYAEPNHALMKEVERIIGTNGAPERHREGLLGRIAAWQIEHRGEKAEVGVIFHDILGKIQEHYHEERKKFVDQNFIAMLSLETDEERSIKSEDIELAKSTFSELERRFGYDRISAKECVKFLVNMRKKKT